MQGDNNTEISEIKTNIAVILERTKVLPDMQKDIKEIDRKQSKLCEQVRHNEDDIKSLETKSDAWNLLNSLGAFVAAVVGSIFGNGR